MSTKTKDQQLLELDEQIGDKMVEVDIKRSNLRAADAEYRKESVRIRSVRDAFEDELNKAASELSDLQAKTIKLRASSFRLNNAGSMWEIIAELGWGTKTTDYNFLGEVLKKLNKARRTEFLTFTARKRAELDAKLGGDGVIKGPSDDGYSDLCWHIIGSGKEVFEQVMKDPKVAQKIYNKGEYTESFAYCLHGIQG